MTDIFPTIARGPHTTDPSVPASWLIEHIDALARLRLETYDTDDFLDLTDNDHYSALMDIDRAAQTHSDDCDGFGGDDASCCGECTNADLDPNAWWLSRMRYHVIYSHSIDGAAIESIGNEIVLASADHNDDMKNCAWLIAAIDFLELFDAPITAEEIATVSA